jgi:hypothetical protein
MPTDRHTATGTCEFGRAAHSRIDPALQEKSTGAAEFFRRMSVERVICEKLGIKIGR